ncbi:MAG: phosphatidylglycerol lysyltransferase domain-containing protein [Duncaniella sp.]|nr:phosphatidylglycerol lysyltransferase domain-containing protein [Duncaniella sp.]
MRPLFTDIATRKAPSQRHRESTPLRFRKITVADVDKIYDILSRYATAGTCDYTVGGIMMWVDYFNYSFAIVYDTLFIKGVSEEDAALTAFSVPVGAMDLRDSVELLRDYCAANRIKLRFSAVPESMLQPLAEAGCSVAEPLADWSDYVYDIDSLATYSGKKYSKKRNHVNRFITDNPEWSVAPLTAENLPAVRDFLVRRHLSADKQESAAYEQRQVMRVLDEYQSYPYEGLVLSVPGRGIVGFGIGEVIGDTVFEHIEKMDHDVAGAGEMMCREFAAMIRERHPEVKYVNREEDAGDPGLRYAKEQLHPVKMLAKYDVTAA